MKSFPRTRKITVVFVFLAMLVSGIMPSYANIVFQDDTYEEIPSKGIKLNYDDTNNMATFTLTNGDMAITSSGENIGIGNVTTPTAALEVKGKSVAGVGTVSSSDDTVTFSDAADCNKMQIGGSITVGADTYYVTATDCGDPPLEATVNNDVNPAWDADGFTFKNPILELGDNASSRMMVRPDGWVGVNTTNPLMQLHVNVGDAQGGTMVSYDDSAGAFGGLVTYDQTGNRYKWSLGSYADDTGPVPNGFEIRQYSDSGDSWLGSGAGASRLYIDGSDGATAGSVGIGTVKPVDRLNVTGDRVDLVAGDCPAGYDWYDENGDTVKDDQECAKTPLIARGNGNIAINEDGYINMGDTDGSGGYGLRDNSGTVEVKNSGGGWLPVSTAAGDITAVGSMTSGDAFAGAAADGDWLGLGAAAGRIAFVDGGTDYVNILGANLGVGDASPDHKLDVDGNIGMTAGGYINMGDTDGSGGYGLRDDSGDIQFKDSGGDWTNFSAFALPTMDDTYDNEPGDPGDPRIVTVDDGHVIFNMTADTGCDGESCSMGFVLGGDESSVAFLDSFPSDPFLYITHDQQIGYTTTKTTDNVIQFNGDTLTTGDLMQLSATDTGTGDVLQITGGATTTGDNFAINVTVGDVYFADDQLIGATTPNGDMNAGFTMDGDDLYAEGNIGSRNNMYADTFVAGPASTTYGNGTITQSTGNALNIDLGGAAGDDFKVEGGVFQVESDNNRVSVNSDDAPVAGIGTVSCTAPTDRIVNDGVPNNGFDDVIVGTTLYIEHTSPDDWVETVTVIKKVADDEVQIAGQITRDCDDFDGGSNWKHLGPIFKTQTANGSGINMGGDGSTTSIVQIDGDGAVGGGGDFAGSNRAGTVGAITVDPDSASPIHFGALLGTQGVSIIQDGTVVVQNIGSFGIAMNQATYLNSPIEGGDQQGYGSFVMIGTGGQASISNVTDFALVNQMMASWNQVDISNVEGGPAGRSVVGEITGLASNVAIQNSSDVSVPDGIAGMKTGIDFSNFAGDPAVLTTPHTVGLLVSGLNLDDGTADVSIFNDIGIAVANTGDIADNYVATDTGLLIQSRQGADGTNFGAQIDMIVRDDTGRDSGVANYGLFLGGAAIYDNSVWDSQAALFVANDNIIGSDTTNIELIPAPRGSNVTFTTQTATDDAYSRLPQGNLEHYTIIGEVDVGAPVGTDYVDGATIHLSTSSIDTSPQKIDIAFTWNGPDAASYWVCRNGMQCYDLGEDVTSFSDCGTSLIFGGACGAPVNMWTAPPDTLRRYLGAKISPNGWGESWISGNFTVGRDQPRYQAQDGDMDALYQFAVDAQNPNVASFGYRKTSGAPVAGIGERVELNFTMLNDNESPTDYYGEMHNYGNINTYLMDPTDGAEVGMLSFGVARGSVAAAGLSGSLMPAVQIGVSPDDNEDSYIGIQSGTGALDDPGVGYSIIADKDVGDATVQDFIIATSAGGSEDWPKLVFDNSESAWVPGASWMNMGNDDTVLLDEDAHGWNFFGVGYNVYNTAGETKWRPGATTSVVVCTSADSHGEPGSDGGCNGWVRMCFAHGIYYGAEWDTDSNPPACANLP